MARQFKYMTELSKSELETQIVIPCIDDSGFQCILIRNAKYSKIVNVVNTDNLEIRINTILKNEFDEYYFHVIKSKKNDILSKQEFSIIFEYLFKKITEPQEETDLLDLIKSIETYFKTSPEKDLHNLQIGVYGELLFIKNMYDRGYHEILKKYHKDFYSKHDVEIDDKRRIEIKTTQKRNRIHRFRHDQIHREDVSVYVASYILESAQEGLSLYDLFKKVVGLYSNMPDSVFELQRLMKKCGVSEENRGVVISLNKALLDERIFFAEDLPQIMAVIPNGVTSVEYDVDCSFANAIEMTDFINMIN